MICPACGQTLPADALLCANCGTTLAPSGARHDPTPRGRVSRTPTAAARHDPGARQDGDRAWRNEVRARVHERRRDRGVEVGDELPLFPEPPREPEPAAPPPRREMVDLPEEEPPDPLADVEIQPVESEGERYAGRAALEEPDAEDELIPEQADWSLGAGDSAAAMSAVERPASAVERAQAAAMDVAILVVVFGLILYFAAKAAHVGILGLIATWPAVVGYLMGLGLLYAGYFTGITGHTPGKMMVGVRVVDMHGRPPGFVRALFRALFGTIGTAAAFVAQLPMIFDPARRALHDRLFGTRVIRR